MIQVGQDTVLGALKAIVLRAFQKATVNRQEEKDLLLQVESAIGKILNFAISYWKLAEADKTREFFRDREIEIITEFTTLGLVITRLNAYGILCGKEYQQFKMSVTRAPFESVPKLVDSERINEIENKANGLIRVLSADYVKSYRS